MPTDWSDFNTNLGTLPAIFSLSPNESFKTFYLWSLQDEITEGTECLYLSVEPVDEFVVILNNNTVTICIEDDDREFISFRFIALANCNVTCLYFMHILYSSPQRYKLDLVQRK